MLAWAAAAVIAAAPAAPVAPAVHVPSGYTAQVWASGLHHPTAMAFGPDKRLYVTQDDGKLVSVTKGSRPKAFASSLRTPLGLLWKGGTLYVSEQGRMEAFGLKGGRRVLVGNLPYGRHQQDAIVLGRDGYLYFGSGSTCDACVEKDRRSAAILKVRPDGKGLTVVASGLRNPYGLAVDPRSGKIYASVNGQDKLGDNEPAE